MYKASIQLLYESLSIGLAHHICICKYTSKTAQTAFGRCPPHNQLGRRNCDSVDSSKHFISIYLAQIMPWAVSINVFTHCGESNVRWALYLMFSVMCGKVPCCSIENMHIVSVVYGFSWKRLFLGGYVRALCGIKPQYVALTCYQTGFDSWIFQKYAKTSLYLIEID